MTDGHLNETLVLLRDAFGLPDYSTLEHIAACAVATRDMAQRANEIPGLSAALDEAREERDASNEKAAAAEWSQARAWGRYRALKATAHALVDTIVRRANSAGCPICNCVSWRDNGERAHTADCEAAVLRVAISNTTDAP